MDIPANDEQQEPEAGSIIKHASMTTRIHQTVYTLESRIVQQDDGLQRSEYRVLLERNVIKDWTEGDVAQYFGLDIY
ncbi:hypothetical protein ACIPLR_22680 [Herbaspirillum huttiense]|jgi:hypothetical protein|uniref:hypothetical protein n=1 Tax=Herbaspirillum TaxID=963 RepID=UPI0003F76EE7|nr:MULTISPECIES: hypothetical protein [Herbaspirillum]MAF05058.1 hypothetical protein [Herbaspirillum sp.]MBN9359675.1 hypothetical protein [Herbaspirillum huttiense]MBO17633.1 hypothetical protein [Herbaspirillum sp.]MCP3655333.1 hypothetical protein [Herbaspirillum sp.]MCP3947430.1 hypothetical protein [Herbaspirillum sp.]|tara:strand:+ start:1013 stop:1243 length:231 start_codon:yes stop_codon:yes gene_type:complete